MDKVRGTWKTKYEDKGRHVSLYPEEYDYLYKVLIVGDSGVGKTSLLLRFVDNKYTESYDFTIGVDFKTKIMALDGKKIKLYIWDTSGQERFRAITASYYRDAHGVLLVYDVTNPKSFENIHLWLQEANIHGNENMAHVVVGNKSDLTTKREVGVDIGKDYSAELGMPFFETSTKDSLNVEAAFQKLIREMHSIFGDEGLVKKDQKRATHLNVPNQSKENCQC